MNIDGKTTVLGVMGDPIEHTGSPAIHNFIADMLGDNLVYVPFHVRRNGLAAAVEGAYELGIRGMNVTVPHKQDILQEVTELEDSALEIGAVNTIVRSKKGYKGFNTDFSGFMRQLDHYSVIVYNKPVIMLGAGGAARAVMYALQKIGASRIYVLNRSKAKAKEEFGKLPNEEILGFDEWDKIPGSEKYICIQCTSVGLAPLSNECVIKDDDFFDLVSVGVDLIYVPSETVFMKKIKERGNKAYNGLRMLIYQAISSYEIFMDKEVDNDIAEALYEKLDS
ncbi:MAG: shikimate dehydrogenase [Lachnospiraceae bacterium]|nr:shikimate dehydrogenase [Lachnospiraceae bacterium]